MTVNINLISSDTMYNYLSWSERGTVGAEVAGSIPAKKLPKIENSKFTYEHIKIRAKLLDNF